ncbi:MAG: multidrug effflux MFS transporter [Methylobacteriaceae bacterium]|nr:multidrug effflux MFS transporter [Methylobacteriaceae bacterium]
MSPIRTALLGALIVALGPISLALYTPAMPTLVEAFGTDPATVKLTITLYFLGFAFAQIVCGPLSDAYGRKPVALAFFTIYLVGSVLAVFAPTITWLLVARALQGIGAAAGVATSRAVVRDQFTGQASARIMNMIGLIFAIGPAISPSIGALLLRTLGWHAIFVSMVVYGLVVVAATVFAISETNPNINPAAARPGNILRSYAALARDRTFMRFSLIMSCAFGGLYTLPALLPFVLIGMVGLTPTQYGLATLIQTASYAFGNLVTMQLLRRYDAVRLVPWGIAIFAAAAMIMAIILRIFPPSLFTIIGPTALWGFGSAWIVPGATTAALANAGGRAGVASAFMGFLQIGGGLAGTLIAAVMFADAFQALMNVMPFLAIIGGVGYALLAGRVLARARGNPERRNVKITADTKGVAGAGREEMEDLLHRPPGKAAARPPRPNSQQSRSR